MKKDDIITRLLAASVTIPSGATVAILTELAAANNVDIVDPVSDQVITPGPFVETDPIFLQAAAEVAQMQPAKATKGVSEEAISAKVAAGLTRSQAIEVIERQIDWDKLPQIRHNHDLQEEDKTCSCCGRPMKCIGEDVTRELEYQQAKLEAHIHVRPKYACPRCQDGVSAAPLPPRPIPGGIAGPGLITEVFVGKFGDHLPLYRLEDILARYGVYLSRSTLCDWMKAVAYLFRPLYELQRQRVLQSSVMWTDDTHVTVLGGEQGSFKGYFWTYLGDQQHPYSVYDFTASRSRAGSIRPALPNRTPPPFPKLTGCRAVWPQPSRQRSSAGPTTASIWCSK